MGLSFSEDVNQYELKLSPTADDGLFLSGETTEPIPLGLLPGEAPREGGRSGQSLNGPIPWVHGQVGEWQLYHLHDTSRMQKTASVDDNRFLRPDGSNLAAFLYYLREKHRDSYDSIRATVQSVAPFFDDFSLEPVSVNLDTIKLEWKHKISDQYFGASSLSDGTLRFIALAALFLQPVGHRTSVILVDEPELGLHPYAIGMLASLIRQASVDTQVIVSTQSSPLLDYFKPHEVLVADRVGGSTQITRLDSARLASWLEEYSLGQLWEKNEFGGRPVEK